MSAEHDKDTAGLERPGACGPSPDVDALRWVRQEHAEGCVPATLAMLLGTTYEDACEIIQSQGTQDAVIDWAVRGSWHGAIDCALANRGWSWQLRYRSWFPESWPPEPFAPLHYASVKQPSGNHHNVVMLADGRVLDPLREGEFALTDWPEVNHVVGVWRPSEPESAAPPEDVARRAESDNPESSAGASQGQVTAEVAKTAATLVDLMKNNLPPHISEREQVAAYLALRSLAGGEE